MNLLAIDTALEACSVAVVGKGGRPVAISETVGRGHAEYLLGMIARAMDGARLAFSDLDRIAVTVGPGSFTGLRVALAAARGLALVVKCPVVGIGTLEVHAAEARALVGSLPVTAVLDARRGEVYAQRFAADGSPSGPPSVGLPEFFAANVGDGDVLAGAGADIVAAVLPPGRTASVAHRHSAPDIRVLAEIGLRAEPPTDAPRPLYLRPPDAKPPTMAGAAGR